MIREWRYFLSVDPLTNKFAWFTPYQYAGNSPLRFIDLDGEEPLDYTHNWEKQYSFISKWNYEVKDVYDKVTGQVWSVMQYPNDQRIYYWQPFDGSNETFANAKYSNGTWNGKWIEFKTRERKDVEHTVSLTRGMALFFSAAVTLPFAIGAAEFAIPFAKSKIIEIALKTYPYIPTLGV